LQNTVWSGLHQFLQIKEGLVLTGENINSSYMSYLSYFKKYKLIYGITGTLGSKETQKAFNDIYKINLLKMPPFKPRQLIEFNPRTFSNEENYNKEIITEIVQFSANYKRVVLVLFEYIDQAIKMEELLQENRKKIKIRWYQNNYIYQK
jgi:preprotein translocase subunit SecA